MVSNSTSSSLLVLVVFVSHFDTGCVSSSNTPESARSESRNQSMVQTEQGGGSVCNQANTICTNRVVVKNHPSWLTDGRVEKVTDKIQNFLEWEIRQTRVSFYSDENSYSRQHSLGPKAIAVTRKSDSTIHLGPKVSNTNFDGVFGHELAHLIVHQKYKKAIPSWLEEGLANFAAKNWTVDYDYLKKEGFHSGVRSLTHPFRGVANYQYHYQASTAVMEMLAGKCSIRELLQLSVGKNVENYLATFCKITNLDESFKKWVNQKAS